MLNGYELPYKSRFEQLQLLSLMYLYELDDLMFLVKCLKLPSDHFNICHYIKFASSSTRSGSSHKLVHSKSPSSAHQHFFFNRIVRLWNHLPVIDISYLSQLISSSNNSFLWEHFTTFFNSDYLVPITLFVLVAGVQLSLLQSTPTQSCADVISSNLLMHALHLHMKLYTYS